MTILKMKMSFEKPAVVIDNGSYSIKAGFSCDNHPVSMFRTAVGRPSYLNGSYGKKYYDVWIGDEAVAKSDLELSHPVEKGIIVHWDNMERIWHHVFYRELKVAPEDRAVILAASPLTTMEDKIKCCEVFFETLNTPALCVQSQNVLSLYGAGFTTGISVDLGYDTVDITPVYEGGLIKYARMDTGLAGAQVNNYIKECLGKRNIDLGVNAHEIIEGIKRDLVYITPNCAISRFNSQRKFPLPDGGELDVTLEAFMAGELFFQPDVVKSEATNYQPLHEAVYMSASKCDAEIRSEMYNAIVPCGGTSMIPGLIERLTHEIENLTETPVNVIENSEAYCGAWLGGATFAGLPDSKKMWVSKKQFEDHGAKIVRNKFM